LVSTFVANKDDERSMILLNIVVNENRYSRVKLFAHKAKMGVVYLFTRSSIAHPFLSAFTPVQTRTVITDTEHSKGWVTLPIFHF